MSSDLENWVTESPQGVDSHDELKLMAIVSQQDQECVEKLWTDSWKDQRNIKIHVHLCSLVGVNDEADGEAGIFLAEVKVSFV